MLENSAAPEFHILVSVTLPFLHHCIKSENRVSRIYDESSRHQGHNVPVVPLLRQDCSLLACTPVTGNPIQKQIQTWEV